MANIVKLLGLLVFMNIVGVLGFEGYCWGCLEMIVCNVVAVGAWIYLLIKGENE